MSSSYKGTWIIWDNLISRSLISPVENLFLSTITSTSSGGMYLLRNHRPPHPSLSFIFDLFLLNFFPLGHSIIYSVSLSFQLCLFCDLSCHQILNDYIFNIQSSVGFFLNPAGLFLIVFCSLIMLILFYFFKHVIKRISYSKYDNPKTLKPLVLNLWFIVSADVHND